MVNWIKQIKIQDFLWYFDEQTFELAIPDNTNPGSGLTILTGQNNTWKTSFFEAIQKFINVDRKRFDEAEKHWTKSPLISVEFSDGVTSIIKSKDIGWIIECSNSINFNLQIIHSRRNWNADYSWGTSEQWNFIEQTRGMQMRSSDMSNLWPRLAQIVSKEPHTKAKIDEILKKLIPNFQWWTIGHRKWDYIQYTTSQWTHSASLLGDGVMSIFRLAVHLVSLGRPEDIIIIDEPELSLHPRAQKELAKIISDVSKERQIIIATHSQYFISWDDFLNWASFIHLTKNDWISCQASKLSNEKYYKYIKNNYLEYQKPYILDITAKEIFFCNSILFVEGQNDVGLLRKYFHEKNIITNFDIFGYWVGSFGTLETYIEIAADLNIIKVSAIYDAWKDEKIEFDKVDWKFGTPPRNYLILQSSKNDIQDKFSRCDDHACWERQIKDWFFDRSGKLKTTAEEDFKNMIAKIITYFNS
jgi:AAA15 family ATPase/GTPase